MKNINKFISTNKNKFAQPPGSLLNLNITDNTKIIDMISYNAGNFKIDLNKNNFKEIKKFLYENKSSVNWIKITGNKNIDLLQEIGTEFNLHPLVLENINSDNIRPKIEFFNDHIFIILKIISWDDVLNEIKEEQISIIMFKSTVLTIQNNENKIFTPIIKRIEDANARIRTLGADYLVFSIIDLIIDNIFHVIELLGEEIDKLDESIMSDPDSTNINMIHKFKRELIFIRKTTWPYREILSWLYKEETNLILKNTIPYFRDIYEHTIQIIDINESLRDLLSGISDSYLSNISNQMNQVMKVLTVISTLFIPPTFIAGIYGMNFINIPELRMHFGYFIILGIMLIIMISMLVFFKTKKWLE